MAERVDEALALAEDWLQGYVSTWGVEDRNLAGWAEAIRELSKEHGTTSMNCCAKCDAIRRFCRAMLGGSDG